MLYKLPEGSFFASIPAAETKKTLLLRPSNEFLRPVPPELQHQREDLQRIPCRSDAAQCAQPRKSLPWPVAAPRWNKLDGRYSVEVLTCHIPWV